MTSVTERVVTEQVGLLPTTMGGVDTVAKFFRALGDATRLRLLEFLLHDEHSVTECVAHDAYRIRFRNFYGRRELTRGRWANDAHIRLFRRRYRFTGHRVHEHLETVSSVGDLDGRILHTPYRDLDQHLRKIVKYARLGAEDLHARGRKARLWELVMRPGWRFLRDYVGYGSYREGLFGLITSSLSALAAFLKYAFLYMLERGT